MRNRRCGNFGVVGWFAIALQFVVVAACSTNSPSKSTDVTAMKPQEEVAVRKQLKTVAANSGSSLDAHREGKAPAAGPLKDIYFDFDRYDLGGDARDMLKSHAQWLKENGASQIEIEGHCDDRGTDEYNLALGARPLKIIWSRWAYRPVGSRRSVTAKSCRCVANRPKSAGGEIVTTGSS
jgi:hypothetical protein